MNTKRILLSGATALSLGLAAGLQAQNVDSTLNRETPGYEGADIATPQKDVRHELGKSLPETVTEINKASNLIGMNVENLQRENLGEIKDLVLDLHSGKVHYAVLSVGGFLGIGEKLIAVPPGAFTLSADQDKLVLNADKSKVENAPAFSKDAWPGMHSSAFAAYWMPGGTARGTVGSSSRGIGAESGSGSVDLDRNLDHLDRTLDGNRTVNPATPQPRLDGTRDLPRSDLNANEQVFRGRITAIDPQARTMTVEGADGKREFKFTDRPKIVTKSSRNPSLIDLKVGYPVSVGYHEEDGTFKAHSVTRTDAPEVR